MKIFRISNYYAIGLSIGLLLYLSQSQAVHRHEIYVSQEELHEVLDNPNVQYDYLGKELSNLYDVICRIKLLDDRQDSVIAKLKDHIESGFSIGLHHAVLEALEYAERVLTEHIDELDPQEAEEIAATLDTVIHQVVNQALTITTKHVVPQAEAIQNMAYRSGKVDGEGNCTPCCINPVKTVKVRTSLEVFGNARFKKNVEIDGKLKVFGKSVFKDEVAFKDDVVFKDDVYIEGDLTVDGTVTFNGPIEGLTIIDVVIENLSATDIFVENLSAIDANIQHLTVTDLTVLSCMDSLCVNNLSVVDETVSGTLSVNDAIITNASITNLSVIDATIQTLSATDAVIQNLSVTDLTVLSCMDSLCVNELSVGEIIISSCIDAVCITNLSVVDLTVSGTASINDAIITNATIDTLSATDAVIQNLSVTDLTVLSCMDNLCVNTLSVGDIVILSCLDSLCVNDLSVVDLTVSGTASINDAIINNATIDTLSVTDAVIQNLSVTDLTVISCIDDLCVIDLSVTDITVDTISVCDLVVSCDIFMNDSTSPTVGNIFKAGNRFIHNFGTDNTFVGVNSGNFTTAGAENVGIGRNALFSNATGFNDTAVGSFSMNTNTIGANNSAYGTFSLVNNTQGGQNVALGSFTLATNTTGIGNTAVGFQSGFSLGTGDNNTFVGNNSALLLGNGFTNVIIGYNSGLSLITGNDNIYISNPGVASESGIIRIGTPATHTAAFMQGVFGTAVGGTGIGVFVDAAGQLGTVVSSARFKHNIEDMGNSSADIYKLRPVTFVYNNDDAGTVQYGLIAEEVDQVFPALVVQDEEGKPYTIRYHLLPQLLLNELQKLHAVVQDQTATIAELKADNAQIKKAMSVIMKRMSQIAS